MYRCPMVVRVLCTVVSCSLALLPTGCTHAPDLTVYCAHDREFAEDVLKQFEKNSGLTVAVRYDSEANKAVGLYEDLVREAARPRCDVHWNNEILSTIRLQRKGLLEPYRSPAAESFPASAQAADHSWHAFAARARVFLVNTQLVPESDRPRSLL